jgi:arsenical pump membrane protein
MVVTLAVFAGMITLILLGPRRLHEAWWATAGALAMLGLGLVSPREAVDVTQEGRPALLFLLGLLLLSLLIGKSGFFEWAAIRCARLARGDGRALYRNTFALGALITATLSLDTTAVILTPVVLALVRRLGMRALPYVALCAFVSNVGSLLLPISNLTNILFADAFHWTFALFAARMVAPQLVALAVTYTWLRWSFRRDVAVHFAETSLPPPASVVPSRPYFVVTLGVLLSVLAGYFLAPLVDVEPYAVAFGGVAVLAVAGRITRRVSAHVLHEISLGLFPFVIGLFIAVRAVENLGISGPVAAWIGGLPGGLLGRMLGTAGVGALASNAMNNLPAALLMRSILHDLPVHGAPAFAALVGVDAGPVVTPYGSLATMLVVTLARREGVEVSTRALVGHGLVLAPVVVLLTTLALAATFAIAR